MWRQYTAPLAKGQGIGYDLATLRRVHPATLWGGLAIVISQPLRLAISGTGLWLGFARWLT